MQIHEQINKKHQETFTFLVEQLTEITKDWQTIIAVCIEKTGNGNSFQIERANTDYNSEFSPDLLGYQRMGLNMPETIRIRFNLGDLSKSPLMMLALHVDLNLNAFDKQKYQVISAYIPKNGTKSVLARQSGIKNFDYSSAGIKQEMLKELLQHFNLLNETLQSS